MTQAQVFYARNESPSRGLAATGVFIIKFLLALPHLIVINALQYLAMALAYLGFWIVAFTGEMPLAFRQLITISFRWSTRTYGWIAGISDDYPPFETDPDYGIDVKLPENDTPSRGLAIAGIFLVKFILIIPHLIVLAFVTMAAVIATWIGYIVALFSGSLPAGIQDFIAGSMQWNMRVFAWMVGFTDEYPPFSLEISPTS